MENTRAHICTIVLTHIGVWGGDRNIPLVNLEMPKFAKPLVLTKYMHFTFKNTSSIFLEKQWTFTQKKSLDPQPLLFSNLILQNGNFFVVGKK